MQGPLEYRRPQPEPEPNATFEELADMYVLVGAVMFLGGAIHVLVCFLVALSDSPTYAPFGLSGGFIVLGPVFFLLGILTIIAARLIVRRRYRKFALVVAALDCSFIPIGTIFGIYAMRVLGRPGVKGGFECST
jgi:hypothetical protein